LICQIRSDQATRVMMKKHLWTTEAAHQIEALTSWQELALKAWAYYGAWPVSRPSFKAGEWSNECFLAMNRRESWLAQWGEEESVW
jgi:hypothetical protein